MNARNQRIIAIIQARMGSSRLPGKVLKEIGGKPILAHVVDRVALSQLVTQVVVATTDDAADDPIANFCSAHPVACYRGSQFDVLDRYYQTARQFKADVIVRVTADCPVVDPWLLDDVVKSFFAQSVDFAANRLPPPWKRSFPIGLDVEMCSFAALEIAWENARQGFEREHVLPYLYDQPGRFKVMLLHHEPDYGHKRWTVDTPQDLLIVSAIFDHFAPRTDFTWQEVLQFVQSNPQLEEINKNIVHKTVDEVDLRENNGLGGHTP